MTNNTADAAQRTIRRVLDAKRQQPGALLPILHDIQDQLGHVPPEAVPQIAEALNLSSAEVHGVISYYHHFRSEAPKGAVVQVCRAEACQACGAEALAGIATHLKKFREPRLWRKLLAQLEAGGAGAAAVQPTVREALRQHPVRAA